MQTDPGQLGGLTVSMLEGYARPSAQGAGQARALAARSASPGRDRHLELDADRHRRAAQAGAWAVPSTAPCRARTSFSTTCPSLTGPARSALVRAQVAHVDSFVAVSDYYAECMSRYLEDSRRAYARRAAGGRRRSLSTGSGPVRPTPLTVGYFGRIAPEKGVAPAVRRLRGATRAGRARRDAGSSWRGISVPEHADYWRSIETPATPAGGWPRTSTTAGSWTLDDKVAFLQALDLFVVPAEYDDPKGLSLIEAMACGVPVVAPRRGSYTELSSARAAASGRAGGLGGAGADPRPWPPTPSGGAELGRRAAEGVRARYSTDEMTARALDVYARLTAGAGG